MTEPGVPLAHYFTHEGCGVLFICCGCQKSHEVELTKVIDRLKARGLGNENTGIKAVAGFSTTPCSRCGALWWETRPAFRSRPKGAGWRV